HCSILSVLASIEYTSFEVRGDLKLKARSVELLCHLKSEMTPNGTEDTSLIFRISVSRKWSLEMPSSLVVNAISFPSGDRLKSSTSHLRSGVRYSNFLVLRSRYANCLISELLFVTV